MTKVTGVLFEEDAPIELNEISNKSNEIEEPEKYTYEIAWGRVFQFSYTHLAAAYGLYLAITVAQWKTLIFAFILYELTGIGVTGGVHRLWAHRSYKATWQLRTLLMIFYTMSCQYSIKNWCRDHRVHHKHVETNADPHNAKRGFFFSHVGWLLVKKNPDLKKRGQQIDMSDLYADPIVMFNDKYFNYLVITLCYILPTVIPVYFWSETWSNSYHIAAYLRMAALFHTTWSVNSFSHLYGGTRPYDKSIYPLDNALVSAFIFGEGWHNYHHVFPWDYKTSELGSIWNPTKHVIELFAKIGWAYDLKSVSSSMIERRAKRTGDGTHKSLGDSD